ncbi:MAG: hypothetical protein COB39_07435 [Marinosulfonomonas sp.]|nr:MAG: hypothetical protein COB39_07435 [Marinosulfonomonas sp.]
MNSKPNIDAFGAASLIGFSVLLGFNQVVIKVVNGGFAAGIFLRPALARGDILRLAVDVVNLSSQLSGFF